MSIVRRAGFKRHSLTFRIAAHWHSVDRCERWLQYPLVVLLRWGIPHRNIPARGEFAWFWGTS